MRAVKTGRVRYEVLLLSCKDCPTISREHRTNKNPFSKVGEACFLTSKNQTSILQVLQVERWQELNLQGNKYENEIFKGIIHFCNVMAYIYVLFFMCE